MAIKSGLIFFFLILLLQANAQQYNNWYFGDKAGVSFQPGALPVPHNLASSGMFTYEACSSISDENGNLLFYSNGLMVFNRNHRVMLNGDLIGGHFSTCQGAIIVRKPGQDSLYYLFTADGYENNFAKGYNYSIINMHKDQGLGAVVSKNNLLQASSTERLTAAPHANGIDIWIITNDRNSNTFRAWLLTCNGLSQSAVVTNSGEVLNQSILMNIGYLKISPDGTRLCQTFYAPPEVHDKDSSFFQVFDFDNATGMISHPRKVSLYLSNVFGCEFSPNSNLLYLTSPFSGYIEQVEAKLNTAAEIEASRIMIRAQTLSFAIQMAPDKKIYCSNGTYYLSVISAPDIKGTGCNYQGDKISLGKDAKNGLPFVLQELDPDPHGFNFQITDSCAGEVQFNGFSNLANTTWEWDFGDGQQAAGQHVVHRFSPAGNGYFVKLKIYSPALCGFILKTKWVLPKGELVSAGFDFQARCDSNSVQFINTSGYTDTGAVHFSWSFGDGSGSTDDSPLHIYTAKGNYPVSLVIQGKSLCASDTLTRILELDYPQLQVSPDQMIDEGHSLQLHVSGTARPVSWFPAIGLSDSLSYDPMARPDESRTYFVSSLSNAGCQAVDSVHIAVNTLKDIYVPSAFTPNADGLNDFFRPRVGSQFHLIHFSVFNRWGQCVFFTKEKGKGWDGTYNGQIQNSAVYIWEVRATTKQGKPFSKKGTVILIR